MEYHCGKSDNHFMIVIPNDEYLKLLIKFILSNKYIYNKLNLKSSLKAAFLKNENLSAILGKDSSFLINGIKKTFIKNIKETQEDKVISVLWIMNEDHFLMNWLDDFYLRFNIDDTFINKIKYTIEKMIDKNLVFNE